MRSFLNKYIKYVNFLVVGAINAAIYFAMLMACIVMTGDYYLSVGISQIGIAVIAYITFSRYNYGSELEFRIFVKFSISNLLLFLVSSALVWITSGLQLNAFLFGIINVLVVAPLSYIFNTFFVFNSAKSTRK